MPPTVRVSLYATAREAVGRSAIDLAIPREGVPIAELLRSLARRYRPLARILPVCRIARNGRYVVGRGGRARPGDEIALHPPYSGG